MRKYSKLMAVLLVFAMILPGVAQAAPVAGELEAAVRLEGSGRMQTAVEVSKEAYAGGSNAVVLAGYSGEVDALTGTLLAAAKDAPVLLTKANGLSKVTEDEIKRLGAKDIYILGGEKAVSEGVKTDLSELDSNINVTRVAGDNRYETAQAVAEEVAGNTSHVFLALGEDALLADALSVGPVSAIKDMPVLLTKKNFVPQSTVDAMDALGVTDVTIVGGENAISDEVEAQLADYNVDRVGAANRERTAVAIAEKYFTNPETAVVAYGMEYADALVGGYLGAMKNAPILLTKTATLHSKTAEYLGTNAKMAYVLGGEKVIAEDTFDEVIVAVEGEEAELKVESVSAIDATTISVTLSDGSVHDVTLDEKLVQNVETEVEFTIDGNDYTETVTWVISSDIVEEELEAAKADLQAKEDALEEAEKDVFEARQELERANKFGTKAEQKAARRALADAKEVRNDAKVERDTAWTKVNELNDKLADAKDYEKVVKAVEKAEKSNKQADRNAADDLLKNSDGGDIYDALRIRLNKVDKVIKAIADAEDALNNVPAVENVNLSHRQAVKNARAAVDAALKLNKDVEIKGIEKLVPVEKKLAELEVDDKAAKKVEDLISKLTQVDDMNLETLEDDKVAIEEARSAYDALTEDQQELVNNAQHLKLKEDKVDALEATAFSVAVNKLPLRDTEYKNLTVQNLQDIVAARAVYDGLSDEAKELASPGHLTKLEKLEATVAAK